MIYALPRRYAISRVWTSFITWPSLIRVYGLGYRISLWLNEGTRLRRDECAKDEYRGHLFHRAHRSATASYDCVRFATALIEGIDEGTPQSPPPPPQLVVGCVYATTARHLGKTFPKAPIPTIHVGAFYAYAFGGYMYRSAAVAAATYVHPVHNARKVHVRTFAPLESDGKKRA